MTQLESLLNKMEVELKSIKKDQHRANKREWTPTEYTTMDVA